MRHPGWEKEQQGGCPWRRPWAGWVQQGEEKPIKEFHADTRGRDRQGQGGEGRGAKVSGAYSGYIDGQVGRGPGRGGLGQVVYLWLSHESLNH